MRFLLIQMVALFFLGGTIRATPRPNIVFLMTDDQQAGALGCMGNQEIETPHIDQLAARGILFERCYATTAICQASRATVLTGMYEYKTGCNFLTGGVADEVWENQSYPVLLKQAGYRTGFAGKWGCGVPTKKGPEGFDVFAPLDGGQGNYVTAKNPTMKAYAEAYPHVTRALGALGRDFIQESAASGKPFCLAISFKAPHDPRNQIDPMDQKRYAGVTFPRLPNSGEAAAAKLPPQAKLGRQYIWRDQWVEEKFQKEIKAYYQLVSGVDAAVGMIVEALRDAGVAENTVVMYTADNGYFCGAQGLGGKVLPYERGCHVPLIISDPRSAKSTVGKRAPAIVGNIDMAPTILDLAGLPIPAPMDGKSLLPVIHNPAHRVRESITLVNSWDVSDRDLAKGMAVVSEEWKYIYWCYGDENFPASEELYHLQRDPFESNNIAGTPEAAPMLERMRKQYDQHLQHWSDHCVEAYYRRYATLFDRKIPWQQKSFQICVKDPKRWEKWGSKQNENYKALTGASLPNP